MRRVVGRVLGILILLVGLAGCDLPRENQPSVLVVAVEGLGFDSISCDSDESGGRTYESMRPFCEEAVRFSHAFAPSTMSQATMASLLTGLYPFDHGVHNNGRDFLSAKFRTVSEAALARGYHTLFISGGAPIWRKSGLAQGFEVFDDVMDILPGNYYRSAGEVMKLATSWIEHDAANSPFFSVLYLNDLQFPQIATYTSEGEQREKTAAAQIEEVSESVAQMVHWLKSKRRWNSTHVVLVGLNSLVHRENDNEPLPLSLKSLNVQVTLFIKPARKEQDHAIQWAVDRNVSLVDVGKTLFEWVGSESPSSSISELEPQSLAAAVTQSEPTWKEDRVVLSESAWPDSLEKTGIRQALRQNQLLYINDKKPLIFNTLTDRLESLPLRTNDPLWTSLNGELVDLLKKIKNPPWPGMNDYWPTQIEVAHELWRDGISNRQPDGAEPWSKWYLRLALSHHDWHEVKRLAQASGDAVGVFVASRNLSEPVAIPHNPCVHLILGGHADKQHYQSECQDERILALNDWKTAKSEDDRSQAQERFIRLYSMQLMDQEIGRLNYLNELRWDVDRALPGAPQTIDYLLTLKELEPFTKRVSALLTNKNVTF